MNEQELETLIWNIVNAWAQVAPDPRRSTEAQDRLMIAVLKARKALLDREQERKNLDQGGCAS